MAAAWGRNGKKTMTFRIGDVPPNCFVNVRIAPDPLHAPDMSLRREEARANWNLLIADLWTRLGDNAALAQAKRAFASVDWSRQRDKGLFMAAAGLVLLFLYFTVLPWISPPPGNPMWLFSEVMLSVGFLGLAAYGVYNAVGAVRNSGKAKRG